MREKLFRAFCRFKELYCVWWFAITSSYTRVYSIFCDFSKCIAHTRKYIFLYMNPEQTKKRRNRKRAIHRSELGMIRWFPPFLIFIVHFFFSMKFAVFTFFVCSFFLCSHFFHLLHTLILSVFLLYFFLALVTILTLSSKLYVASYYLNNYLGSRVHFYFIKYSFLSPFSNNIYSINMTITSNEVK